MIALDVSVNPLKVESKGWQRISFDEILALQAGPYLKVLKSY